MISDQPCAAAVRLLSTTSPRYQQTVIGKLSSHTTDVEEFKGIPYGKLNKRWTYSTIRTHLPCDVFDATRNGPRCPQPLAPNNTANFQSHLDFPYDVEESEFDCLNLIISRPTPSVLENVRNERGQTLLPVYVYVHGGAFAFGAASDPMWDPVRLVSRSIRTGKPIIVVRINYRLNIFGFLASSELLSAAGCNFGFFDQVTALRWITINITAFGGDPAKMTLGGQSAGGTSAYIHALRALYGTGKVCFRSCIIQSPATGLCGPFDMHTADQKWNVLCQHLGLTQLNPEERLSRLRSVSSESLLATVGNLGWSVFTLTEEESLVSFSQYHAERINTGICQPSPPEEISTCEAPQIEFHVLLGTTSYEASIFVDSISEIRGFEQLIVLLEKILDHEKILDIYELKPGISMTELHDSLYRLFTDTLFAIPALHAVRKLQEQDFHNALCLQQYDFNTGNPFPGQFHGKANHCVDLIYLFDCFHDALREVDRTESAEQNIKTITNSTRLRKNTELVDDMQSIFIDFIHSNFSGGFVGPPVGSPKTIVVDTDRGLSLQDPLTNVRLQERESRVKRLETVWESACSIVSVIVARKGEQCSA